MADALYTGLTLDVRQVPESSVETDPSGNKVTQRLPGFLEIGVWLDGAWVVVQRFKAPGILADIKRAQDAKASQPQQDAEQTAATDTPQQ